MQNVKRYRINEISGRTNLVINLMFIFYCILCIAPIVLVLMVSFTDEQAILLQGYKFLPGKFSLYAYEYLFNDISKIARGYGVTIFTTVVGTILNLLLTSLFAYPLSRRDLPFRKFLTFFIFFTMLFNGGLVPWYLVCTRLLNLKNTIWALIIPSLVSPFNVLIMRTFFQNTIPDSIIEAARIDGASELRTFFQIVVPLSKPVFATIGLFCTIAFWNNYFLSMMFITKQHLYSLQYLMFIVQRNIDVLKDMKMINPNADGEIAKLPQETIRMAMVIVGIGPIIFAYPFFQKYFVKGLVVGAVKG
jgi:putative aldouronate transport system permease protein